MRRAIPVILATSVILAGCGSTTVKKEAATPTTAAASITTASTNGKGISTPVTTTPKLTDGALGDSFTVSPGDRKITAYTFKRPVVSTDGFTKPMDGYMYAAADVQECAGPSGERFSPNRFDFEIAMADNTRVQAGVEVQTPQLASSPLQPGDCIRGWVSFEIPTTATARFVVYSSGNASAKWVIP